MFSLKDFLNILKCSFHKLMRKSDFPKSIIPKENFVLLMDMDNLLEHESIFVLRRSDRNYEDTFNDLGILRDEALSPREVPNLSINLLGGFFKPEHTKYRIINRGMQKWGNYKSINISEYLEDFEIIENYTPIFIEANNINEVEVPYTQHVNKDITKEVEKFFSIMPKPSISGGKYHLQGKTKLVHDPTNLNYWHAELRLENFKGDEIKYKKSAYISEFCEKVISDIICANAYPSIDNIPSIPEEYYLRY